MTTCQEVPSGLGKEDLAQMLGAPSPEAHKGPGPAALGKGRLTHPQKPPLLFQCFGLSFKFQPSLLVALLATFKYTV